jgi:hypothetical protein
VRGENDEAIASSEDGEAGMLVLIQRCTDPRVRRQRIRITANQKTGSDKRKEGKYQYFS